MPDHDPDRAPLEKGAIVENGSHADLLDQKGQYYAMWRQQIGERAAL